MEECKETRRSVCINCCGVTMGTCERGKENCMYYDFGPMVATIAMVVMTCLLFWGIIIAVILKEVGK